MAKYEYTVTSEDGSKTLKAVVKEQFAFSSRLMTRLRKGGLIRVNGETAPGWIPLKEGDLVTADMPEETTDYPPEDMDLDIVYEDGYLLAVNKEPYVVMHPTKGNPCHTLLNGLIHKMMKDAELPGGGEDPDKIYKIRMVNRLDMNTSGLVVIAKDPHTQAHLVKQMKDGRMVKRYKALVEGIIDKDEGTIDLPLGKPDENEVERWAVPLEKGGRESVTHYKVIERYEYPHEMQFGSPEAGGIIEKKTIDGYTLAELKLDTGRTHQIRIHMSYIGHPVAGDHLYCHGDPYEYRRVYGDPRPPLTGEKGPRMETNPEVVSEIISRQALHAWSLDFIHPVSGEKIHLETDLPKDIKEALKRIQRL